MVHLAPHVIDDILFKVIVDHNSQPIEELAKKKGTDDDSDDEWKLLPILVSDYFVDDIRGNARIDEAKAKGNDGAADGPHRHQFVGKNIAENPTNDLPGCPAAGAEGGR